MTRPAVTAHLAAIDGRNPATFPPSITESCVLTLMKCWRMYPNDMWKIPSNVVTQQAAENAKDPKFSPIS
jgi:hypothetical protein